MKVIYVDDEPQLLENFRLTVEGINRIDSLQLFSDSAVALQWTKDNPVDIAFLDVEMPVMNGIELARELKKLNENILIVFATAFTQYALDAFGVEAIAYLLKPYSAEEVEHVLDRASRIRPVMKKRVVIRTMPDFMVTVDERPVFSGHTKQEELLALLVDRGDVGITANDAITCLWEGNISSESIFRVNFSRLKEILKEAGIEHILATSGNTKYLRKDQVDCDLYRMLAGDAEVAAGYSGSYLRRFYWAEERNRQLLEIKKNFLEGKKEEKREEKK